MPQVPTLRWGSAPISWPSEDCIPGEIGQVLGKSGSQPRGLLQEEVTERLPVCLDVFGD